MRFTLPATVPADTILDDGYALQWFRALPDQGCIEAHFSTPFDGFLASGYGATPADAMCGLLSAFPDSDEVRLPACVAAALDELAHQAVRIVCDRLSGGTMDSATFAEPHLMDTQAGPVEHDGECDQATIDRIEQKFLKLLAEQEPDHPWVCKLRTPREGNHPRSKEHVLR